MTTLIPGGPMPSVTAAAPIGSPTTRAAAIAPEQAAWVRANAWTQGIRKTFAEVPGFYLACACQSGSTTWCATGRCDQCHRAEPLRTDATSVLRRGGTHSARFSEPYAHKTDTSATGPSHTTIAQAWLADRVCRWVCPCDCHQRPARVVEQLDLFGELVST